MSSNYPSSLDTTTQLPQPAGTSLLTNPDHAAGHTNLSGAVIGLETKLGVSAGSPTLNTFLQGSGNGTSVWSSALNNVTLGTPRITGGTVSGAILGTNQITGGTANTLTLGTPTLNAPVFSAGAVNTADIADSAITNRKMKMDKIQYITGTAVVTNSGTAYVDYTGMIGTVTPNVASSYLVLFSTNCYYSFAGGGSKFRVMVDGTVTGQDPFLTDQCATNGNIDQTITGFLWITGISGTSHAIKVQQAGIINSGTVQQINLDYGALTIIPFAA